MKNCSKVIFDTLEEANQRVIEITKEDKISDVKPIRAYQCNRCYKYHITSISRTQFEVNKIRSRQKNLEFRSELSYWCRKLGVNKRGENFKSKKNVRSRKASYDE